MNEKEFYETVSCILGVEHHYKEPLKPSQFPDRHGNIRNTYKGRYNGREGGNGRFQGSGIVRNFGTFIQVRLTTPVLHGNYKNFDEAVEAIGNAMRLYLQQVSEKVIIEIDKALTENPVGYRIATPEEIDVAKRNQYRANELTKALVKARIAEYKPLGDSAKEPVGLLFVENEQERDGEVPWAYQESDWC